ncbi:MAG: DUF4293 domain-containing protein [Bacteroidales bacterium]|nr:DUF4293 domain-containing protein [Bacteroidales bacterium]
MIQRIQTLYLFLVGMLMLVTLFFPLVTLHSVNTVYELDAVRLKDIVSEQSFSTLGLFIVGAVSVLIALITIFLYKNRILQIRLTIFNTLVIIGFCIYVVFLAYSFGRQLEADWVPAVAMALPVICVVLNYLAVRGIGADEALVRSLDRLR